MTIYGIAGSDRVDAGKTTFATGLIAHAGATGVSKRFAFAIYVALARRTK